MADEFKGAMFATGQRPRATRAPSTGMLLEGRRHGWTLYSDMLDVAQSALRSAGQSSRWMAENLGMLIGHYLDNDYSDERLRSALAADLRHDLPMFADHIADRCVVLVRDLEAKAEG